MLCLIPSVRRCQSVIAHDVVTLSYVTFCDFTMAGHRLYKLIEPTASQLLVLSRQSSNSHKADSLPLQSCAANARLRHLAVSLNQLYLLYPVTLSSVSCKPICNINDSILISLFILPWPIYLISIETIEPKSLRSINY